MAQARYWNRRNVIKNAAGVVLLPVLLYVMFGWFEQKQVFHPSTRLDASGADLGQPWEDVHFKASDGTRLNGWFFPSQQQTSTPGERLVVVLCHGNAGNISHRLGTYQLLLNSELSVFAFDYRGYGRSSGTPSESGTYLDAEAAYDWVRAKGFPPESILVYGESLGGAVATELALRRPVRALMLVSTFTSIPDIGAELFPFLPVRLLSTIRYDTLSKLPRIKVPVLIMHSKADSIVGFQHSQKLFAAANPPKMRWELIGDHNDALTLGTEQCYQRLADTQPNVVTCSEQLLRASDWLAKLEAR
jgi:uncharacterized protein